ncbi:MAG TPA: ABC transporter permease [Gemmatimonadales bacterium]
MLQDVRYALRTLARSPGLSLAAVLTLGLGIGANSAIFGVVDRLFFRPPAHVVDPDRVVRVSVTKTDPRWGTITGGIGTYPDYLVFRARMRGFSTVAATMGASFNLGVGEHARRVTAELVSASFFPLLGVRAERGRFFTEEEDRVGRPAYVAVVSHAFWRGEMEQSPDALGKTLLVGHNAYTVIGVAPDHFAGLGLREPDLWLPMSAGAPEVMGNRNILTCCGFGFRTIARLAPGVSAARAAAEGTVLMRIEDSTAILALNSARGALDPNFSSDARLSIWLAVVSGIVLLIACANVANLLLARAAQRRREVAVRVALGAGRGRLIRQLYTESAVLAACGGTAAVFITLWAGPLLRAALLPDATTAGVLDLRLFAFTAGAILVTALLAGLSPALQAGVLDLSSALKSGPREGGMHRSLTRSGLLVAQVALTLVLLTGAGLFITSLRHVQSLRLGFDADHLIVAGGDLGALGYKTPDITAIYERIRERVARLPGVAGASLSIGSPFGTPSMFRVAVPGVDTLPYTSTGGLFVAGVTPDYFRTMGTIVLRGRVFTDADNAGARRVVVVNQTMARLVWPGQDPIGKCMKIGDTSTCSEVVGVVEDARLFKVTDELVMQYFIPLSQFGGPVTSLEVRTIGPADAMVGAVRREVQATSRELPYMSIDPMPQLFAGQLRVWRQGSMLLSLLGGLALLLAAVGLYGVLSYVVSQRTQELGIRIALGAASGDLLRLVVRQGLGITVVGVVIGVVGALAGGKAIAALLYGVSPHDPLVLGLVTLLLLSVAAVASYLPARRASRVDPVVALRAE